MSRLPPVAAGYTHGRKVAVPGEMLALGQAHLKWYDLAPDAAPVPSAVREDARRFLADDAIADLDLAADHGFVILHRCGASFFFLLVSLWRGSNELWETVYYHDADVSSFARFDPAYPRDGPRPTFCVWELGIVGFEATAWSRYLSSSRDIGCLEAWQASQFTGAV